MRSIGRSRLLFATGQVQQEAGPAALLRFDRYMAFRLLDEAIYLAEPEAGPLADLLGGEERFERPLRDIGIHTRAGVADAQPNMIAREQPGQSLRGRRIDRDIAGRDLQLAAGGHRIARVDDEIEQRCLELHRIDAAGPQARLERHAEGDCLAKRAAQEGFAGDDRVVEHHDFRSQGAAPGKREQLLGQLGAAICRRLGRLHQTQDLGARNLLRAAQRGVDHFQARDDHRQQIVEVVRDAAGKLADRVELLGVPQHLLRLAALGAFDFQPHDRRR